MWRDNLGGDGWAFAEGSPDANGIGNPMDAIDFDFWKANFAASAPAVINLCWSKSGGRTATTHKKPG